MNPFASWGEIVLHWVLQTTWQATVLAGLILLAQLLLRKRIRPSWRYGLWLLLVIRLLMPVAPPSPVSIFNLANHPVRLAAANPPVFASIPNRDAMVNPDKKPPAPIFSDTTTRLYEPPTMPETPAGKSTWKMDWWRVMLWIWLAGVGFFGARLTWTHWRFRARIGQYRRVDLAGVRQLLEEGRKTFGIARPVRLIESAEVESPAVYGLWRTWLLLPKGVFERFSPTELRCIFFHELAHIKRGDLVVNWLVAWLQVLHWFNPVLWLAWGRMRADRELATDALALVHLSESDRKPYGEVILKVLAGFAGPRPIPGMAGILENKTQLKERLAAINRPGKTRKWTALVAVAALAALGLTGAQKTFSNPTNRQTKDAAMNTSNLTNRFFHAAAAGMIGLALATPSPTVRADDLPAATTASAAANLLPGAWVLEGGPDNGDKAPTSGGRIKLFTGTHWCIVQAEPKSSAVIFHHGGTYTVNGNQLHENLDFANASTMGMIGKTNGGFMFKVEGDTLTYLGINNPWKEAWKRLKSPASMATPLAESMTGTWAYAGAVGATNAVELDTHRLKFCAGGYWCDTEMDARTGVVTVHHGGVCSMDGDEYVETCQYANPTTMNLIGRDFKFKVKVDGDTLTLLGVGNPWNEIWKRLK